MDSESLRKDDRFLDIYQNKYILRQDNVAEQIVM